MADKTLDDAFLILIDNWPGRAVSMQTLPTDGFTGATHHNVASAIYPVGTKIEVINDGASGLPGPSTFIYLKVESTGAPTSAAKQVWVIDTNAALYTVTNDKDGELSVPALPSAVGLSLMTDSYYGWVWCGGVCPVQYVSGLGGNYATTSAVALGSMVIASELSADAIGFGIAIGDATDLMAAYTLSSDAA